MKHCRRIPIPVPVPAIIKTRWSSRSWLPLFWFNKPNFSCKCFVKSYFAKAQESPGIAGLCRYPSTHRRASLRKMLPTKTAMGAADAGFDCSAVLLSVSTSSWPTPTIPTHLEEGAALGSLTAQKSNTSSLSLSVTGGILILYRIWSSWRSLIPKARQKSHLTSTKVY